MATSNPHKCPYTECVFDMKPICRFSPFFLLYSFSLPFTNTIHSTTTLTMLKLKMNAGVKWRWFSNIPRKDFSLLLLLLHTAVCMFVYLQNGTMKFKKRFTAIEMYTHIFVYVKNTCCWTFNSFNWKIGRNRNNEYDFIAYFHTCWVERMVREKICEMWIDDIFATRYSLFLYSQRHTYRERERKKTRIVCGVCVV